jgi:hypothetical protein
MPLRSSRIDVLCHCLCLHGEPMGKKALSGGRSSGQENASSARSMRGHSITTGLPFASLSSNESTPSSSSEFVLPSSNSLSFFQHAFHTSSCAPVDRRLQRMEDKIRDPPPPPTPPAMEFGRHGVGVCLGRTFLAVPSCPYLPGWLLPAWLCLSVIC